MTGRKLSTHRQALADQIVAILRDAEGFPMSTGDVAEHLGGRLVTFSWAKNRPAKPRPACWTDDVEDIHDDDNVGCQACGTFHRMPVYRYYQAEDVRPLLNSLARRGEVEKVVLDDVHQHYWRREDTDQ